MTNELLLVAGERFGRESTMKSNEKHMKIITIGLVPVFLLLAFTLPDTTGTAILLEACSPQLRYR
jgi:hypothetical protein